MSFHEIIESDLDEIFFDEDFFGSTHTIDGKALTIIVDDIAIQEIERLKGEENVFKDKNAICKNPVLVFVKESDLERKFSVDSTLKFDGALHEVFHISKQCGMWKLVIGRRKV